MSTPKKVIVIGAGWSGLAAAKTYLEISQLLNRPIDLTVLDNHSEPGGVWSLSRLYPGLLANSPNGLFEFSSLTMVDEKHPWYEFLPGERVQEYLEAYSRKYDIFAKTKFNTHVTKATRKDKANPNEGWIIETEKGERFECDKLVVASGLYSKPRIPTIPNDGFTGESFHSAWLGSKSREIRADPSVKDIVIVGGCKSAVEAASIFMPENNPGKKYRVSWVVRPSETGVPIIVYDVNQRPNLVALAGVRVFGGFSPSIFQISGFMYRFIHSGKSFIGNLLRKGYWAGLSMKIKGEAKYDSSANGRAVMPKGKTLFYDVTSLSLIAKENPILKWLHMDDESVLKVYRTNPRKLQGKELITVDADGKEVRLPCDAVIWCTGWEPTVDYFDPFDANSLGVPMSLLEVTITTPDQSLDEPPIPKQFKTEDFNSLYSPAALAAEEKVLELLPQLRNQRRPAYPTNHTNFRLYRQIVPTESLARDDHSIAFSGMISNAQTAVCSELTALWSVAWLEDLLPKSALPKTKQEAEDSVELVNAWMRRRFGMKGAKDPEIVQEIQTFFDVLCRDLGVEIERKKMRRRRRWGFLGWWDAIVNEVIEMCTPYTAKDYEGVVEEFLRNNGWIGENGKAS